MYKFVFICVLSENIVVFLKYEKWNVCQYLAFLHELNTEKVEVVFIINQLLTNKTCDFISFNSGLSIFF